MCVCGDAALTVSDAKSWKIISDLIFSLYFSFSDLHPHISSLGLSATFCKLTFK